MKKWIKILLTGLLAVMLIRCGGSKNESKTYEPESNIDWIVTSSPGGGSDIYTRIISDILTLEKLIGDSTVIVTNKTDGSGEVGRNEVAHLKGKRADNTLLTFNSGDLIPMIQNTKNRAANFKILAIMAVDKQIMLKSKGTKYNTFAEAIEAAKNGHEVIIGGSKGDDIETYKALLNEIEVLPEKMKYITYNSTGDAITAALGNHVEFVIAKPAASTEYITAGDLYPVLALSTERYTGSLADVPTLSEIGEYEDVEVPVWRGIAAAGNMSESAVKFWSEAFKKVSETEKWKKDYLEKNKLIDNYLTAEEATKYVTEYEKNYMETREIK